MGKSESVGDQNYKVRESSAVSALVEDCDVDQAILDLNLDDFHQDNTLNK